MSKFHTFIKNDSSSDSEEGELSETNDDFEPNQEVIASNEPNLNSKSLITSKSLQIVDKIDRKRNNRFSIWSDLLLEEDLNDSISNSMDIKKRQTKSRKMDRNCENYSFWTKKQLETDSDKRLPQEDNHSENQSINKRKNKKKKKRNDKSKQMRQTVDIVVEMAKKLNEPKVDLMRKVCDTIGEQKTSELISATLDIESAGGLMTNDGKRRRTAGGVFFQLLKNDANIPKESVDSIFSSDQKNFKQKKNKKKSKRKECKDFNKTSLSEKIKCESNESQSIVTETQSMDQ